MSALACYVPLLDKLRKSQTTKTNSDWEVDRVEQNSRRRRSLPRRHKMPTSFVPTPPKLPPRPKSALSKQRPPRPVTPDFDLHPCPPVKLHPVIPDFIQCPPDIANILGRTSIDEAFSSNASSSTESDSLSGTSNNKSRLGRLTPRVKGHVDLRFTSTPTQSTFTSPNSSSCVGVTPTSSVDSSLDINWVRATKTSVSAKVVSAKPDFFQRLPDNVMLHILSYLSSDQVVTCSNISRRFYFLAWDTRLWHTINLAGNRFMDVDLALRSIFRVLNRTNGVEVKAPVQVINLNHCHRLTDRGLAIVARRCPNLRRLEVQHCINVTNGGLMDLMTKCRSVDHLDVTGCHMISTIAQHQPLSTCTVPPPQPPFRGMTMNVATAYSSRQLNLQYLDLTDCVGLEDSGLKKIVEASPSLLYLFLRRCTGISDVSLKHISSYCLSLRELSVSDCPEVTDFGLYELAKLGPSLRYLSVAKCDQVSDSGIKQVAKLCYKLRYLNLRGCEAISDDAIETIARSCSRIRSLDIGKCDATDTGLKSLSENCPNLKKLSVKSCEMATDRGIQYIAYFCRGLQQLNIQDCPVTIDGYKVVKKFCRKCIIEHTNPSFY